MKVRIRNEGEGPEGWEVFVPIKPVSARVKVFGEDALHRRHLVALVLPGEAAKLPRCIECDAPFRPESASQKTCSRTCTRRWVIRNA